MRYEPFGVNTLPDVEFVIDESFHVGVEVIELTDKKLLEQHAARRDAEILLGITQEEAAELELNGRNPTPEHISRFAFSEWTPDHLRQQIGNAIVKKDQKVMMWRANGSDFTCFSELLLAIFTGKEVSRDAILMTMKHGPFPTQFFDRVAVVLDYHPGMKDDPVVMLPTARL